MKTDKCLFPSEKISGNNLKIVIPKRKAPLKERINLRPTVSLRDKNRAKIIPKMAPKKGSIKTKKSLSGIP